MSETTPEALLDLAIPRKIKLHDRGRTFLIGCRRIEPADWLRFFSQISVTSEQNGSERISSSDSTSPGIHLAESVIVSAEGYTVRGGADLTTLPSWQSRLPLAHRFKVGATLANVRPSAPKDQDFCILPEGEEVFLDCDWSYSDDEGAMVGFERLRHVFRTPTQAQQKRYYSASSRSIVVGGSRTGKTIYAGAQETLCDLYDELILSVEGYSANGHALDTQIAIWNWMDLQHKFVAAEQLFNPAATATTEAVAE